MNFNLNVQHEEIPEEVDGETEESEYVTAKNESRDEMAEETEDGTSSSWNFLQVESFSNTLMK